jgi:hypothetical protein
MPLVDVTCSTRVTDEHVALLADVLPHAVSTAVECPEEPYDGVLKPGDVEVRFHARGPSDVGDLDVLVEVHSKWFESRAENRQARCDAICRAASDAVAPLKIGIYLSLPIAAWTQSE